MSIANEMAWLPRYPDLLPRVPMHWGTDSTEAVEWRLIALPTEKISWYQQQPDPVRPVPRLLMQYLVEPLEETLYQVPDVNEWFLQPPDPVRRIQQPIQDTVFDVEAAHESIVPKLSSWFQETQQPVRSLPLPSAQYSVEPLVETLYQVPNMNSWFLQPPDPVRRVPQTIITEITPHPEWRELTLPSGALSWCVQQPDPIFPQWNDRQTEIAQRAAMTLTDATFADTDTHVFQRGDDDQDVFPRK